MPLVSTAQWFFFFSFHFGYRIFFQYFKNISKLFEFTLEKPATTDHPKNLFGKRKNFLFLFQRRKTPLVVITRV